MSIKLLKSRGSPPWGCTMRGFTALAQKSTTNWPNLVVRFFTPDTQTEVAKTVVPTSHQHLHVADDTTNSITSAAASDQATLNTLLNEIKTDYNAHRVSTTFHSNADTTNAVTSADSTSEATAVTLANEIKLDFNAHRSQATIHLYPDPYNQVTTADSTNLATAITLANVIKTNYNAHRTIYGLIFTVYGIAPGTYDIGIKTDGYTSALAQDAVFTPGVPIVVIFGFIYGGDVNNDDQINVGDSLVVSMNDGLYGGCNGYAGNWLIPEQNTFGDWTVIPTARRKTY